MTKPLSIEEIKFAQAILDKKRKVGPTEHLNAFQGIMIGSIVGTCIWAIIIYLIFK